jgi:uncharacterized protein YdeI (YjbR/CyaY-like superfamily)
MPTRVLKTVEARTPAEWRAWLATHHDSEREVWLVFHKRGTDRASIAYEDAVSEAICFGWIDSLVKRLDDARYARKFTPRKPGSRWSTANRRRYARLQAAGRLMPPGLKLVPTNRSGAAPRPPSGEVPRYIQRAISSQPLARDSFQSFAPSYQRMYVAWIDSAKKPETKMRRLREAVRLLAAGKKLGLK